MAWADCDVIIEGVYQTPYQEHTYLQPEAGTAYIDDEGRITVHCAGQWTWEDQHQIAHSLDLPPEKVRVIYDVIGGVYRGFGGPQSHFAAEIQMNKLAEKLGLDPVEIRLKNVLTADKPLLVGTSIGYQLKPRHL